MCLHHGCDQGKALLDPQAKLGLIWYVCDEAVDGLVSEGVRCISTPRTLAMSTRGPLARDAVPRRNIVPA
eukprot:scaffold13372_cov62-Phaeocystis_antarctica.AAC.3